LHGVRLWESLLLYGRLTMVVNAGRFILMCFGNLIWPGLGSLVIGSPMGWISSPVRAAKHAIARRMEER
jgi:hypothetical protein